MNTAITEKTITVKTLTVDGRNMSKAFFNQIPTSWFVVDVTKFEGEEEATVELRDDIDIWGYVSNTPPWLVFTVHGELQKAEFTRAAVFGYEHTLSKEEGRAWTQKAQELRATYPQLFIGA